MNTTKEIPMRRSILSLSLSAFAFVSASTPARADIEALMQTALTPETLCAASIGAEDVPSVLSAAADAELVADVLQARAALKGQRDQMSELEGQMLSAGESDESATAMAQLSAAIGASEIALADAVTALRVHSRATLAAEVSEDDVDLAMRMIQNTSWRVPAEWKAAAVSSDEDWAVLEDAHALLERDRTLTQEQAQLVSAVESDASVLLVRSRLQSAEMGPVTGAYVQTLMAASMP